MMIFETLFMKKTSVNFWDRHLAEFLENKSENIACEVTVETKEVQLYLQIGCQLGYLMTLISNGICQYERKCRAEKICVIFKTVTERDYR